LGNLNEVEIKEFGDLEFNEQQGLDTVSQQVRRYYLKIKSEDPQRAESMLSDIGDIDDATMEESDILKLCANLHKHISGFQIYYKGEAYRAGGKG